MAGTTAAVRDRLRSLLRDEEVAENLSPLAVRQRHLQRVLDVPARARARLESELTASVVLRDRGPVSRWPFMLRLSRSWRQLWTKCV